MKFKIRNKNILQKILIVLLITISCIFAVLPDYQVFAEPVRITTNEMSDSDGNIMTSLLKQIMQIIDAIGDIVMGTLNHFMVGADGFTSAMLSVDDANLRNADSWLIKDVDSKEADYIYDPDTISTADFLPWVHNEFDIPNFLYTPEAIFSNNIAALDVNFLNPNEYNAVSEKSSARSAAKSAAGSEGLRKTISDWYISFRNIAIVGLLSVLVYLGIRILISSTAIDKAKYKENLQNWLVALCLVFFIHFIMSGLLMITDKFTDLFDEQANSGIIISAEHDGKVIKFNTNLTGFIRFNAQSASMYHAAAYSLLYLVIVIYTGIFTVMYFKRFLYMAFLTMIAPLVALTYPIDKAGDGRAQSFNIWFKEYIMHLILQPVHLILYIALISSSMELVKDNIIYALVAIGFLIPAEKFIKKMFSLEGAQSTSSFGSFAGGALAMKGLDKLASLGKVRGNGSSGNRNSSSNGESGNTRIRTQDRSFAQSFNDDDKKETNLLGNSRDNNRENIQNSEENNNETQENDRENVVQGYNNNTERGYFNPVTDQHNENNNSAGGNNRDNQNTNDRTEGMSGPTEGKIGLGPSGDIDKSTFSLKPNVRNNRKSKKQISNRAKTIGGKVWKATKAGARIGARGVGVAGGAMIGLAAGVATGDLGKTFQYAGAGAVAGNVIGKKASEMPSGIKTFAENGVSSIKDSYDEFKYASDEDKYGTLYAANQANKREEEREKTKFMRNKEELAKYKEMAKKVSVAAGRDVDAKELMESAFDYKRAGITDENQIEKGLTMEAKYKDKKDIHENMLDIVGMTSKYGEDYIFDDKKRESMQKKITSKVKGEKNQDKVWDMYTETLGYKNLNQEYRIKRPKQ